MNNTLSTIRDLLKVLTALLPFLAFVLLDAKTNLKRPQRSKQCLMPILALIYCIAVLCFLPKIANGIAALIYQGITLIGRIGSMLEGLLNDKLAALGIQLSSLARKLQDLVARINLLYWVCLIANSFIMLAFVILKRILITFFKLIFKDGKKVYEKLAGIFYSHDEFVHVWYVKSHLGQARTYLKTFFIASVILSTLAVLASSELYKRLLLVTPFYPVFGIIVLGEIYFFLNGLTRPELLEKIHGTDEEKETVTNYSLLRQVLRKLFGDKLTAEDTNATGAEEAPQTADELLEAFETTGESMDEAYARYMRGWMTDGRELDRNYLCSGHELLHGKSILFNNPFYYDLIPYAFYPMNRVLMRHKKVLIVLGRHGMEQDVCAWCETGLHAITNVPELWNIGVLTDQPQTLDVGVLTRSSVHDLQIHEANAEFFAQTEFVVLIEPSRLVTTAQVGLNSIIRLCRRDGKQMTFCSTDKNCDGLVDALSHILMTSISEVSATNRYRGVCSYMCWETDREHLQHRMLPNLSRYLGMGTELSFVALKNQVAKTAWYGGEAFPVVDMHWIVKQYYYDLLHYAELPISQKIIDQTVLMSHNLWDAQVEENRYLTVEDEACNMFEVKRDFSTRATGQSFINVISPDYLLKDYMAENDSIFNADPKAIPYIVADYARTARNVVMRLLLRMGTGKVGEGELRRELMLINADTEALAESFWHLVCAVHQPIGQSIRDKHGVELLCCRRGEQEFRFGPEVIRQKRKFSMQDGAMETQFFITDARFKHLLLDDLQNAGYIAEDENGQRQYLGAELRGHIFQKYLPGQFLTFNGKYYEMLSVASNGEVLLRRAADHINGRPAYRQVRRYVLSNAVDSETMGDCRDIAGLRVTKQYADLRVETPAYWRMDRYNDFTGGRKITVNGLPDRTYYNKQILRIELPAPADAAVCRTLALLMNEVFRTIFAENQDYIVALTPGEAEAPLTYSLTGEGAFTPTENSIYLVEDSQLDLGLLVAAERNLDRVFSILCDYLDWHMETLDRSMNPPPPPEVPEYAVPEDQQGKQPKTWIGRVWKKIVGFFKKIGGFFKRIGAAIAAFFRKLFKRKKKAPETPEGLEPQTPETEPEDGAVPTVESPETPEADGADAPAEADEASALGAEGEPEDEPETGTEDEAEVETGTEDEAEVETGTEDEAEAEAETGTEDEPGDETGEQAFRSMFSTAGDDGSGAEDGSTPNDANDTLEFEPEQTHKPVKAIQRKPYHERYYLLYGGAALPEQLDLDAARDFLKDHGFADGALKQARDGKDIAEMIEKNYTPNKPGSHYCDFCGVELVGTEYEVLSDGRERCTSCGRTSVKTAEEFEVIYRTIARNMEAFFGAKITAPVRVQMVNSKKLHRKLGKTFVPTGRFDGRVLGVAIQDRDGYSILVENGAPRMSSIMTIAHELTHIWQYLHWDRKAILRTYGKEQELEIYEGMAKWTEIQYAYLIGEPASAKREEISARVRQDEYGRGFCKYVRKYPLSTGTRLERPIPFDDPKKPL